MKTFPVKYRGQIYDAQVDDEDALKIEQVLNKVVYCRGKFESVKKRHLSYIPAWKNRGFRPAIWVEGKLFSLSRWLLSLTDPSVSHLIVDHIDQNPLNNRRNNLRIVDRQINAINSIARQDRATTSKYKGVSWNTQCQRWQASITVGGTKICKFRKTEEEAYAERLKLEEKYFVPLLKTKGLINDKQD